MEVYCWFTISQNKQNRSFFRMTDVHPTEIRSYNMSRIKGKNSMQEMLVRKFLFANGLRGITERVTSLW